MPVFPDVGHEVKVVDESGNEVERGKVGELIRKSPAQMLGYWKDDERTAETIKDGWLYSGDFVTMIRMAICTSLTERSSLSGEAERT